MPDSALATFAAEPKAWRERIGLTQSAFADNIGCLAIWVIDG